MFFLYSFLQIDHPEFEMPPESKFKKKNYLEVTYQRLKKVKIAIWCRDLIELLPGSEWSVSMGYGQ